MILFTESKKHFLMNEWINTDRSQLVMTSGGKGHRQDRREPLAQVGGWKWITIQRLVCICVCLNDFFFFSSFKFTANWEEATEISHISLPQHMHSLPCSATRGGHLFQGCTYTDKSLSSNIRSLHGGFTLRVVRSTGLNKCIMTCVHRYGIRRVFSLS